MSLVRFNRTCVLQQKPVPNLQAGGRAEIKTSVVEGQYTTTILNTDHIVSIDPDQQGRTLITLVNGSGRIIDDTLDMVMEALIGRSPQPEPYAN